MKKSNPKVPKSPKKSTYETADNGAQISRAYIIHQRCMPQQGYHPKRKWVTLEELIEATGVKADSVRRCIHMMRYGLNMPIEYVRERGGYGYTQKVTHFPLMMISEKQVTVLAMAQQIMKLCEGTDLHKEMENILKTAILNLGPEFADVFEKASKAVSFHTIGYAAPAKPEPKLFGGIMQSVMDGAELDLVYQSPKVGVKPRKMAVRPLHLSNINHAWYVWLEGNAGKPWKMALTRIRSVERTTRLFTPAKPFDIDEELRDALGVFNSTKVVPVHARFTPEATPYILEREWHESMKLEVNPDGSLDLRMPAPLSPELHNLLLPWAGKMEVVGPVELREEMRDFGRKLFEAHGGRADALERNLELVS